MPGKQKMARLQGHKRRIGGGVAALVGYLLSPLSWWNDLFVNVPLAVGAAWLVAWIYPPGFQVAAVVAYWMTNVLGLVMLHRGTEQALGSEKSPRSRGRQLWLDVGVSLAYTALILLLLRLRVLQPVDHYFRR
jgi:hypothetical protein